MRAWRRLRGQTVVFHLKTGRSVRGVVWETRDGLITLRDARLLAAPAEYALDGETLIESAQVEFAQKVIPIQVVG